MLRLLLLTLRAPQSAPGLCGARALTTCRPLAAKGEGVRREEKKPPGGGKKVAAAPATAPSAPPRAPTAGKKSAAPSAHDGDGEDEAGGDDAGVDAASPKDMRSLMQRHVDYAKREFTKLRGATISPNMLDHITVEAYGERQPLASVAQVALKGPMLMVVNPFDTSLAEAISDAIRDADLNLNPQVDGTVVRVPVPKPSKETKEATAKLVSKIAETAKNRVRRVRQAAMDKIKKTEGASTDDTFREMKEIEAMTASATAEVAAAADKKRKEVEQG